jgi:hypothetical protein
MLSAEASSAICVQRFDGSRNSAIHTTYRISLRSSSLREPRYPLLRVVFVKFSPRREPRGVNGCGVRVCDNGGSGQALPSREARRAGGRS